MENSVRPRLLCKWPHVVKYITYMYLCWKEISTLKKMLQKCFVQGMDLIKLLYYNTLIQLSRPAYHCKLFLQHWKLFFSFICSTKEQFCGFPELYEWVESSMTLIKNEGNMWRSSILNRNSCLLWMMHEDSLLEEKYEATVKSLLNTRVSSNIFLKASLSFLSLLAVHSPTHKRYYMSLQIKHNIFISLQGSQKKT